MCTISSLRVVGMSPYTCGTRSGINVVLGLGVCLHSL